jgi:hypothetical protein
MPIDTAKVTDHRRVRFNSIEDVLADIDRIVAAEQAGKLRCTGNWTAGQVFNHLASWINFAYEGYPGKGPPWFIRIILKMKKKQYLRDGMRRGVRIPGVKDGTFATDALSTQEGAQRLRAALLRMKNRDPVRFESPAFGAMEHDERIAFQCRHAELHMGYLHPG